MVSLQSSALFIDVTSFIDKTSGKTYSILLLLFIDDACTRSSIILRGYDLIKIEIPRGACCTHLMYPDYLDLLDQTLIVGINRIKTIHLVVDIFGAVRRAI